MKKSSYFSLLASLLLSTSLSTAKAMGVPMSINEFDFVEASTAGAPNGVNLSTVEIFIDFEGPSYWRISGAGDVNGDGLDDVIIGAPGNKTIISKAYVVYGQKGVYSGSINLTNLNTTTGFVIQADTEDNGNLSFASSVSGAGDVNGDGIDDVIIGALLFGNGSSQGYAYVVYGTLGGYSGPINIADFNATVGFEIQGKSDDLFGNVVSSAGDVNADGIDDVIITAPWAQPNNQFTAGSAYVVYGREGGYPSAINLANFNYLLGFEIQGAAAQDSLYQVAATGDVNGDGIDDVIVGASALTISGQKSAGAAYIVYGKRGGYSGPINLANFNATVGFEIQGYDSDHVGVSVSGAGDVNGDGIDDVVVGAGTASYNHGTCYVIYGRKGGYPGPVSVANLSFDYIEGFIIEGPSTYDYIGSALSGAGDVNGDGMADIIVGASDYEDYPGLCYVIYGRQGGYRHPVNTTTINSTVGFTILPSFPYTYGMQFGSLVSNAGDWNGDGRDEVLIGGSGTSEGGKPILAAYLVSDLSSNSFKKKN